MIDLDIILTVTPQSHVVRFRGVIKRERDVVGLRKVQHGLQEQTPCAVEHDDVGGPETVQVSLRRAYGRCLAGSRRVDHRQVRPDVFFFFFF